MRVWWIFERGETRGPFTSEDFEADVRVGRITATTLVWTEGLPGWTPLAGLKRSPAPAEARKSQSSSRAAPAAAAKPAPTKAAPGEPPVKKRRSVNGRGVIMTSIWAASAATGVALLIGATLLYFMPAPSDEPVRIAGLQHSEPVTIERPAKVPAGLLWTNPATGKQVELPAGWRVSNGRNEAGEPLFVFRHPDEGLQVVFASENIEPGTPLTDYLQALTGALSSTVRFGTARTAVKLRDKVVVEQQGHLANEAAAPVQLSVVPNGDKVWRTVSVGRTGAEAIDDLKLIRERLFESL